MFFLSLIQTLLMGLQKHTMQQTCNRKSVWWINKPLSLFLSFTGELVSSSRWSSVLIIRLGGPPRDQGDSSWQNTPLPWDWNNPRQAEQTISAGEKKNGCGRFWPRRGLAEDRPHFSCAGYTACFVHGSVVDNWVRNKVPSRCLIPPFDVSTGPCTKP